MSRYFIDLEFLENGPEYPIHFLSLGMLADDGREFRAVNKECPIDQANDWVQKNVLPYVDWSIAKSRAEIRDDILAFVRQGTPESTGVFEFWAGWGSYDWVVFCQIFGRMIDLPPDFPMYIHDIKQLMDAENIERKLLPIQQGRDHDPLEDARWVKDAYDFIDKTMTRRKAEQLARMYRVRPDLLQEALYSGWVPPSITE